MPSRLWYKLSGYSLYWLGIVFNNGVIVCWGNTGRVNSANVTLPVTYTEIIQPFKCLLTPSSNPATDSLVYVNVVNLSSLQMPCYNFDMSWLTVGF